MNAEQIERLQKIEVDLNELKNDVEGRPRLNVCPMCNKPPAIIYSGKFTMNEISCCFSLRKSISIITNSSLIEKWNKLSR